MVFLVQSLESREEKLCILCNINLNYIWMTNIISHYIQVFKLKVQCKSNHIVSFRKFKTIHEIKEGPQNMRYLLLHVGTKFFHLGAHVHFFDGINFNLQL
jgi:hypothetical protein